MKGKKTGGRQKGTTNKTTAFSKSVILDLLSDYKEKKMKSDFNNLRPVDRMQIFEKLVRYLIPQMQSTSVDVTLNDTGRQSLEESLALLSRDPGTDPDSTDSNSTDPDSTDSNSDRAL